MGYNAVEFLPLFDFANVEIPYKDEDSPVYNDWNPYAANHWGYMPTFLFAPEGQYASDGSSHPNAWSGTDGRQINEFKTVVKELHKNGIAVIMDVVYNHVSQYDNHPLKQMNKNAYFRQNEIGEYSSVSGCGNDLMTEHPFIRQMIIESVLYWMEEFHIDGFRFDLGKLLDWKTVEEIREKAVTINPNVFITCETAELVLPKREQIQNDRYRRGETVRGVVKSVENTGQNSSRFLVFFPKCFDLLYSHA